MATSTIVIIAVLGVAAVLVLVALAWLLLKRRTQGRRVKAADIRHQAAQQSHEVGQREALADQTAAKARAAQAEAQATAARASGLQHQAETRRGEAASARHEVEQQFGRADKVDPDAHTRDTREEKSGTRDTRSERSGVAQQGDRTSDRDPAG
jgi:flagellar biosynthesis GTPase FlhF